MPPFSFADFVDILAVAAIIYMLLRLIRGTRGLYMLTGLLICILILWLARLFELRTLDWLFGQLLASLVLIVVVVFQHDIRRLLTKLGRSPFLSAQSVHEEETIEELVKTVVSLANKKIGAIIAIERGASVADHVEQGVPLDARIHRDLLTSIFLPVSPLHDGAVIIQGARVAMAGCLLRLSMSPEAAKVFGTRHRAALGLSEETDAVVLVVSEERGIVSMVREGEIEENLDAAALRARMRQIFSPGPRFGFFRRFFGGLLSNYTHNARRQHPQRDDGREDDWS